jgi:hypothetical protein
MKFSVDGKRLDIELNYLKALTDKEGFKRLIRIANSQIITEEDKDFFRNYKNPNMQIQFINDLTDEQEGEPICENPLIPHGLKKWLYDED